MKYILKKSLKFGVMFSIIAILLIVINVIIKNSVDDFASYQPFIFLETFTKIPGESLLSFIYKKYYLCIFEPEEYAFKCPSLVLLMTYAYLVTIFFYFIFGIIIGFLYGKLKENNQ
ncbi:MAG: hypothetical protein AABW90_00050 [Nanoarchaeota archaeon]